MSSFIITQTRNVLGRKRFRVNLVGDNGEKITTSEPLNSREAALKNIEATKRYAPEATNRWVE